MPPEGIDAESAKQPADLERRKRIIRIGIWIIFAASVAGWLLGLMLSSGQDVSGAAIAQAMGVLGAGAIAVPAGLVVAWAAWRPWPHLNRRYKILVALVWLLVLMPVAAGLTSLVFTLLEPTKPTYLDLP